MRYGEGWANDPKWSQYKRAISPLTQTLTDDTRADATMPIGSGINNLEMMVLG